MKIKKYKWLTIFNSFRCDKEIPRERELELKDIIKEIKRLSNKMELLFKKEKSLVESK